MTVQLPDSARDQPIDATAAAEYFLAGAREAGLAHVVVSPGSRSTALAIAATRCPGLTFTIELDERVAGFVALGYAKSRGVPVGLICTSGTAAANYLPAVSEAAMSDIPLLVMTADRPPEHQGWGVGQAFDQRGLFARQVRAEVTMPVGGEGGARFSQRAGWRAAMTAVAHRSPVHVNWAFRLPLEPDADPIEPPASLGEGPTVENSADVGGGVDGDALRQLLDAAQTPLLIAGPMSVADRTEGSRLVEAAASMGMPVLADVLSGLPTAATTVGAAGLVVSTANTPQPDLIIRVGDTPTAKAVRLWWEQFDCPHVLIDPHARWHDPSHMATTRVTSSPAPLLSSLVEEFSGRWSADVWLDRAQAVDRAIDSTLAGWPTTTEAHVARIVGETASAGDIIMAASSMPVRDLDLFASTTEAQVLSNRGINGIDGVVATAHGVALAQPESTTITVLIGDIATIHDIGGLLSAARAGVSLRVVIVNNDGGGIFSRLAIREALDDALFRTIFHTPHGTTFAFLSEHPGVNYVESTDVRSALRDTANAPGVVVIEVPVETPERLHFAETLRTEISHIGGQPR